MFTGGTIWVLTHGHMGYFAHGLCVYQPSGQISEQRAFSCALSAWRSDLLFSHPGPVFSGPESLKAKGYVWETPTWNLKEPCV